jgi:hypothetical protein
MRGLLGRAAGVFLVGTLAMGATVGQNRERESAWEALVARDPGVVDDERVGWEERLALDALTPEQAVEYRRGVDPGRLILADGRILEEYLEARLAPTAGVYVGLSAPCSLFSGEWWPSGSIREVEVRGRCGIPEAAFAVVLELRAETLGVVSPRVKVWARDLPEPAGAALEGETDTVASTLRTTTIVNLCADEWCEGDLRIRSAGEALLEVRVLGYFRPLTPTDNPAPIVSFFTEGESNNFFGEGAGANTFGVENSFFGGYAGNSNSSGSGNSFFGRYAGFSNGWGVNNSYFGSYAGYLSGGSNNAFFGGYAGHSSATASDNAFFGAHSGYSNIEGGANAFFGRSAGYFNSTGSGNAFFGAYSGYSNTTGVANSFFGRSAGASNSSGGGNAFFGHSAGVFNTEGARNAFFGRNSGLSNTTGEENAFIGSSAGYANLTGSKNAFLGPDAGLNNTTGSENAFVGFGAGASNTSEHNNTFIGTYSNGAAGITNATALGHRARVSRSNSLVLGSVAGVNNATASVNVGIGVGAPQRQLHLKGSDAVLRIDRDSNTAAFMMVRTGLAAEPLKTFVMGTNASGANNGEFIVNDLGTAVGGEGARRMTITNAGETHFTGTVRAPLFVQASSLRFKTNVATLRNAPDLMDRLRGVSFVWRETGKPSIGLIAEETAEVLPEIVEWEEDGPEAAGINYAALTAVLVEALKAQRAEYQSELASLRAQLAELGTVKARLAAIESLLAGGVPQVVAAR